MDKQNTLQAVFSAALTALACYFNVVAVPLAVLIIVLIIDYATGMVSAWHNSELSSKKGIWGIIKKICYVALVFVGMSVDYLIYNALSSLGVAIDCTLFFGLLVTIWLIINELISILENLSKIGVPLPKFITSVVTRLKNTVENAVNDDESEEKKNG